MKKSLFLIALCFAVFASVLVCLLLHHYDNKYVLSQPQAIRGALALQEGDTDRFITLVSGWEFYQYKTLTPEDIHDHSPDAYIFIGQYSGFEMDDPDASPYGEATYRYCIDTGTDEAKRYMLYMPEIYTSYKLWINGELMDINPNATSIFPVSFVAEDTIEIIISASNDTHYYSGLIYPPLFGSVNAITTLIFSRAILFSAAMIFAVIVGIFALVSGRYFERRTIGVGGFVLCLFYAGSISYVVVHSLGLRLTGFWYTLEDVSYFAMIAMAGFLCTIITSRLKKLGLIALFCGGLFCLFRIALIWLVLETSTLYLYSHALGLYKIGIAVLIVSACVVGVIKKEICSSTLLCGSAIYAVFLIAEVVTDPVYEPIRTARFSEIGGLAFVAVLGLTLLKETIRSYREKVLQEKRIIEQEKRLTEKELELAEKRIDIMLSQIQPHFLHNTLATIEALCNEDNSKTAAKMVRDFSNYLRENMDSLTQKRLVRFTRELSHIKIYLDIEKQRLMEKLTVAYDLEVTDFQLPTLVVQPLVENAVRYGISKKRYGGTITISTRLAPEGIKIIVSDDGAGFDAANPNKQDERSHIGIANVRERLSSQCGGSLMVESAINKGTVCTVIIPQKENIS